MSLFSGYVTLQFVGSVFPSIFYGYYFRVLFPHKFYKHIKQMEYDNNEH